MFDIGYHDQNAASHDDKNAQNMPILPIGPIINVSHVDAQTHKR